MNYQLMAKLSGSYGVEKMARVLKVSRSGYYAWVDRSQSARECGTVELTEQIRDIQRQMHHRYGTPRVTRELARRGRSVGHNRVARILREKSLGARPKRRFRVTTKAALGPAVAANELDRNFWAARANQKWVSDITYVATAVFRQAEIPRKIVQKSPSVGGDFCLAPLTHESMLHPIAFPLKEQYIAVVGKTVDHRGGHLVVGEDRSPL